jgi:hypothetical protein
MAVLKFRVYWEDDDAVYRDVVIKHNQSFKELNDIVLKSFEFDNKHKATFYRSNDQWQRGREITLEKYDKTYVKDPLLMDQTQIGSEIKDPNQKFIYIYDFNRNWTFQVELISVIKEENQKIPYPSVIRTEGLAPSQYGTRSLLGDKFVEVEEKYDLSKGEEGFGTEGEGGDEDSDEVEGGTEESGAESFGEEL